jgi:TolB-like protein
MALTEPGRILGTIGYMAPEQVRGEEAEPTADIFALGCILFEMASGVRAFNGATPSETIAAILGQTPDLGLLPGELAPIVAHCLEKTSERRFQSARDIALALRALLVDSEAFRIERPRLRSRSRASLRAVAVLPFVNVSGDPEAEYLSDGLTESVINSLSQLPKLRVVPRSTVFRYKGHHPDLKAVGLALNVRALLMGRVLRHGDVLNVQAELVDVATESQLWGDQYRQNVTDAFAIQEQIAWQISEALRIRLTAEEKRRLAKPRVVDGLAYQDYLRGRFHWNKWTEDDFRKAAEFFESAIARDPGYALAYSGLGDTYGAMAYYGFVPPRAAMPRSHAAAARALELDARLAEPHTTMALYHLFYEWDWPAAEREFRRALDLNPKYPIAVSFYGLYLATLGRYDE